MISELYLHSRSGAKPLRVGVMIDGFQIPQVFHDALTDIKRSDFANVELVIVNQKAQRPAEGPGAKRSSPWQVLRDRGRRRTLVYDWFQTYDRRRLRKPNPLEAIDSTDLLGACSRLDITPADELFMHRFPPDATAALHAYDLDLILRFGFRTLCGEVLKSARYGVWSFRYGTSEYFRGGPALFREVMDGADCSDVSLLIAAGEPDAGLVLCKSSFPTVRGFWPSRNIFQPCWGSYHFVIRKLHELHEQGWNAVKQNAIPARPERAAKRIHPVPSNLDMVKWLVLNSPEEMNLRVNPWRKITSDQWRICIRPADSPQLITGQSQDKSGFRWMPIPRGHYYADPILIEHEGQVWIFFEDYIYEKDHGRIGCAPVGPDGTVGKVTICMDLPYHLSYPFVFHHDGDVFMVPESVANGSVELWRATEFPFSWELEKKLTSGLFVDTTPVLHESRWYFFTALLSRLRTHAAFGAVFSSPSLTGEWELHPASPISTDVRSARPAGAILKAGNRLLLPVQDCGERYGRRIQVEEIEELSPVTCRMRRLHSIEPDWDKTLKGVHTYGFCAGFEVLDAVRRVERRAR
jgi:hypothetical protein